MSRSHIKLIVWERGAGRTLACGTGACAAVVAGILCGRLDRGSETAVDLPGGRLFIRWTGATEGNRVQMVGPATYVFKGEIYL